MLRSEIFNCQLGKMLITCNDYAVVSCCFTDIEEESCDFIDFPLGQLAVKQLSEYFLGISQEFAIPLQFQGSEFEKMVFSLVLTIPYGETMSYKDIGKQLGDENCAAAVKAALMKNPLGIFIPCHRVVNHNGSVGSYAYGSKIKSSLIEFERKHKVIEL